MGAKLGAEVHLDRAPLKYEGLRYDEIWISESQERMILAVPPANVEALRAVCDEEGVGMADLGVFGIISGAEPTPHVPVADLTIDFTAPARAYDRASHSLRSSVAAPSGDRGEVSPGVRTIVGRLPSSRSS